MLFEPNYTTEWKIILQEHMDLVRRMDVRLITPEPSFSADFEERSHLAFKFAKQSHVSFMPSLNCYKQRPVQDVPFRQPHLEIRR